MTLSNFLVLCNLQMWPGAACRQQPWVAYQYFGRPFCTH